VKLAVLGGLLALTGSLAAQRGDPAHAPATQGQLTGAWVAAWPDQARDSLRTWLAVAVAQAEPGPARVLARAEFLGRLYAEVWGDSFPLREVRRFTAWPPAHRVLRVRADSLRRAGNAALGRAGLAPALRDWRTSHRIGRTLADTGVMAAALGNIGTGFYYDGQADSARVAFTEARRLAALAGDQRTMLNAMTGLASLQKDEGDLALAARLYTESLAGRRAIGDYAGVAADANNLGLVAAALGDAATARRRHLEALVTAREHRLDQPAATALLNLGALAAEFGDETTARRHYEDARVLFRRLGAPGDEALTLHNLGLLAAGNGDYPAAATRYREALALLVDGGSPERVLALAGDLAQVLAAMGELADAEVQLGVADAAARSFGIDRATAARLKLVRGDLALLFNRHAAARRAYGEALAGFRRGRSRAGEAEALAALGALDLQEEDYRPARDLLDQAATRQRDLGDRRNAALTSLLAVQARAALGDSAGARAAVEQAIADLRSAGDPVGEAWAQCAAGDLARDGGLPLAAEAAYRAGLARLGRRPAAGVLTCLTRGLGGVLRGRAAPAPAIQVLAQGITGIEATAGRLEGPGRRADFLVDKWGLYEDLALAQRAAGDVAGAFATSERLRARQTLDLVARGPVPPSASFTGASDPGLAVLRQRITALLADGEAGGTPIALRGDDALGQLRNTRREALARAQAAYAARFDSLGGDPGVAAPARAPAALAAVRAALAADEALVEYLLADSVALAFVVLRDGVRAVELPTDAASLAATLDFLRGTLTPGRATRAGAPWAAPLRRLHRELVAPLEAAGILAGVRRLIVIPHGVLHYLPFAALQDAEGHFLVERYEVGYAPSASVWQALRQRPAAMGRGILALAPHADLLPGTGAEVAAISRLFGADAVIRTGPAATRAALLAEVPGRAVLHLATLGVLNKHNPLFSFVALTPTGGDDGRLEVHDVARLQFGGTLVVLSACQTGLGSGRTADLPPGDDWVGLVQAFQAAGAANVLGTLWPVDDARTAALMAGFYASYREGAPLTAALARAQRALLAEGRGRSPWEWAGFVVNGRL